jgi:hypothetical protein
LANWKIPVPEAEIERLKGGTAAPVPFDWAKAGLAA